MHTRLCSHFRLLQHHRQVCCWHNSGGSDHCKQGKDLSEGSREPDLVSRQDDNWPGLEETTPAPLRESWLLTSLSDTEMVSNTTSRSYKECFIQLNIGGALPAWKTSNNRCCKKKRNSFFSLLWSGRSFWIHQTRDFSDYMCKIINRGAESFQMHYTWLTDIYATFSAFTWLVRTEQWPALLGK